MLCLVTLILFDCGMTNDLLSDMSKNGLYFGLVSKSWQVGRFAGSSFNKSRIIARKCWNCVSLTWSVFQEDSWPRSTALQWLGHNSAYGFESAYLNIKVNKDCFPYSTYSSNISNNTLAAFDSSSSSENVGRNLARIVGTFCWKNWLLLILS